MHHEQLAALSTEARWHAVATLLVLPLLVVGMVSLAVLAFGAAEMGLATARRRAMIAAALQTSRLAPVPVRRLR